MTDLTPTQTDTGTDTGTDTPTSDLAETALVEEVSIDGMCGVY